MNKIIEGIGLKVWQIVAIAGGAAFLIVSFSVIMIICSSNANTASSVAKVPSQHYTPVIIGEETTIVDNGAEKSAELFSNSNTKTVLPSRYEFNKSYEGTKVRGVLSAFDSNGKVLWLYTTGLYECTTGERVQDIGEKSNGYYLMEDGYIILLEKATGKLAWKSTDRVGATVVTCFDSNNNIYATSYWGFVVVKIDANGKTNWKADRYTSNTELIEKITMVLTDGLLQITYTTDSGSKIIKMDTLTGKVKEDDYSSVMAQAAGNYIFASGAGAWCTELTLKSDGTFTADYHDSDMGSSGKLDGKSYSSTEYVSKGSGKFKIVEKINDYSYKVVLESFKSNNGAFDYIDYSTNKNGTRKIATKCYGIEEVESFIMYTSSAPISAKNFDFASYTEGKWAIHPSGSTLAFIGE